MLRIILLAISILVVLSIANAWSVEVDEDNDFIKIRTAGYEAWWRKPSIRSGYIQIFVAGSQDSITGMADRTFFHSSEYAGGWKHWGPLLDWEIIEEVPGKTVIRYESATVTYMDTAKGAAVAASHEGTAWEYTIEFKGEQREATSSTFPIVAVPTTAGTGSEVSGVAVLSNHETRQKGPVRSPYIYPRTAIIDPELTLSMPPALTAATGFDALSHALERYLSMARHSVIDLLAEDAIRTIVRNLKSVVDDGANMETRSRMMWASTQAAMCIGARLNECGLHILGLPLSAHLGTAHGVSLAALAPFILEDAAPHFPEKCARLAGILGAGAASLVPDAMRRWLRLVWIYRFAIWVPPRSFALTSLEALIFSGL